MNLYMLDLVDGLVVAKRIEIVKTPLVSHCYTSHLSEFPDELIGLLKRHGSVLHADMLMGFVKSLVLLRNKNLLPPTTLLILFFQLLRCSVKNLRKFLQQHIITDIKNINAKSKNMKLNKELQNFMHEMLKDKHAVAAKMSLDIMIELYRKRVWNDAKTVNIISTACFSKVTKIMVAAIQFFIGKDEEEEEDDSDSDSDAGEMPSLKRAMLAKKVNKKTNKKMQQINKVKATIKKQKKKLNSKSIYDFSALHLVHDPQDLAEKLYKRLEKMNERFEVKLMTLNFISRLIGVHQLYLPNFYPLVQRFLFPHQREATKVMAYAAQAAHPLVPPDDLEPVVRTLANNFVTERCANEVMAMGLNAIRALCARNPHAMNEDLLQDLAQYKSHKDKGVMMAARSLISLFREKNPQLLARKDRGAPTEHSVEQQLVGFGQNTASSYISGAEVLSLTTKEGDPGESSDDEWINVSPSDSEDADDSKEEEESGDENEDRSKGEKLWSQKEAVQEVMKMTPEERVDRASEVLSTRLLTDADFERIAAVHAAKQVEKYGANKKRKRERLDPNTEQDLNREIVSLKSIEMVYKKRRHDKEARLESVKGGREGRENYSSRKGRMNPLASTTNTEKSKGKTFMMIKHKVKKKQKDSFRVKQMKLRNALLKQRNVK
ncbi:SDA1 domain containing protein Mys45A isoform X2 [Oratosquilla oratoria]|uniref:SDA1 domain containing protein Mys45A isoform X2 n=1 Tax=Oratosquilla oratoria TaxID=337810 RepID=UPI003F75A722